MIVPTRNPSLFWRRWLQSIQAQSPALHCLIVDSSSTDGTNFSALPDGWQLLGISASDFNHGATRNLALQHLSVSIEVVVFMTQDSLLADVGSVQTLVSAMVDTDVACAFGRQLPHADATPLATHAREFNYPATPRVVSLKDKSRLGLKACFMSNSFAAYRIAELQAVGGFPRDVILGEDMAVAARLLLAGKRVAYAATARAYHSHNYTPLEDFQRYFDTGVFHARERWLLDAFGEATGEGFRFVKSELRYLIKNAPWLIPSALLRTVGKVVGYRLGRAEAHLPVWLKRHLSMFKAYWR